MITIKKKIKKYNKFLLAYSGGLDSTVLLYQLLKFKKKKNISIRAIHIDHQINKNSKNWSNHCKKICQINNVPFQKKKITIPKKNIECNARNKRYQIFKKHLLPGEILLTGHNLDDQCETLFLSIKRGSGLDGLSGIAYKKKFFKNYLLRPLLTFTKKKIKKWAISQNLQWIEDKSNNDISYDRNFLRHKIIPKINTRWKYFKKSCLKVSKIIYQNNKILNKFILLILKKNLNQDHSLNIKKIKKLEKNLQYIIIKKWISIQTKKKNYFNCIKEIIKNVIWKKKNKNPKIKFKKYTIWNYHECLYWIKNTPQMKKFIIFWHYPYKKLILPKNFGYLKIKKKKDTENFLHIPLPKKKQLIYIKFHTNEKIKIKNYPKKIKKIFNELKIPPWKRKKIPLIFYDNKFISAIGYFVKKNISHLKEKKISIIWNNT